MKRLPIALLVLIGIALFLANALYQLKEAVNKPIPWDPVGDLYSQYLPLLTLAKHCVLTGSAPLWNPYQAVGRPLFAVIGLGLLYPVNWVIFLLDIPRAMLVIQFLSVAIGMAGMVLYLRYLKLEWPAVILASLLFGYSVLAETFTLCIGSTYCWLPVILWLTHRVLDRPGLGTCLALTLSLTLCFLAGFAQHFYYICIILFIYLCLILLFSWFRYELKGVSLRLGLVGLAFVFMAGLVAVQFLPTLELSLSSVRSVTRQLDQGRVVWIRNLSLLGMLGGFLARGAPHSVMPYFGSSLLLIPFAFGSRRHRSAVIALSAALGYTFLFVLSKRTPALAVFGMIPFADSFRIPERIIPLGHFMIVVLAGIGLSSLLNRKSVKLRDQQSGRFDWFSALVVLYTFALLYPACSTILGLLFRSFGYIIILLPLLLTVFIFLIVNSSYPTRVKGLLVGAVLLVGLLSYFLYEDTIYVVIDLIVVLLCVPLILTVFVYGSALPSRMKRFVVGMTVGLVPLGIVLKDHFEPTGYFVLILVAFFVFLLHASELPSWTRRASMWAVMVLILFDVVPQRQVRLPVPAFNKATSADSLSDEKVRWTKTHAGHERVLLSDVVITAIMNPNIGSMFQFHSVNSYDSFTLARWENYVRCVVSPEKFDRLTRNGLFYGILGGPLMESFIDHAQMSGLASLRYFVTYEDSDKEAIPESHLGAWNLIHEGDDTNPKLLVYENEFALPRAYLVNNYLITQDEEESLRTVRDNISSLSHSVILENGEPSFPSADMSARSGRARIDRYGINEVELHVEADAPSLLVLTDSYYPGWNAFVDGARTPIRRANSLFRAVETPAGSHTILFKYQPSSLRWGAAISLGTLFVILIVLFTQRQRAGRRLTDTGSACRIHSE